MLTALYTTNVTGIQCNACSIDTLFDKYAEVGFLYPRKMTRLRPHFERIRQNWQQLRRSPNDLLWILTNQDYRNFASISVIKHGNYNLMAQHLVSDGNPRLSLQLMAQAQALVERMSASNGIKSAQNWFRPNNRYAYRIFASMLKKLGTEKASLLTFEYLHQPLTAVTPTNTYYEAQPVELVNLNLIRFVEQQYNFVFCQGEELTHPDMDFGSIGQSYQHLGLHKSRRVIQLVDPKTRRTVACVIANRAPIGLNFSFLENRAYFIVDAALSPTDHARATHQLSACIKDYYADLALQAIPIVTDERTADELQQRGAQHIQTYMQSIWVQAGFAQWREHIESFLLRISKCG